MDRAPCHPGNIFGPHTISFPYKSPLIIQNFKYRKKTKDQPGDLDISELFSLDFGDKVLLTFGLHNLAIIGCYCIFHQGSLDLPRNTD